MPQTDLSKKRKSQRDWYNRNKESERRRTAARRDALRRENRQRIDELKESMPCADCKQYFPAICMDFDHLDPETKVKEISLMTGLLWAKLEEEIAKCEIVCANCHRIRTRDRLHCSMGELADPPGSEPGDSPGSNPGRAALGMRFESLIRSNGPAGAFQHGEPAGPTYLTGGDMETLVGGPSYPERFGWYYRPATFCYEFWWQGAEPKMIVTADVVEFMPDWLRQEITLAVSWKGSQATLND